MTNEEFVESVRLEGEEWRDVVGYEGCYLVSSFGRVVSLSRIITEKTGKSYDVKPRMLKMRASLHGGILYHTISLCKNGIRKVAFVHRLVAFAFIPNPYNRKEIDHIDTNGLNNSVSNLRWCTHSENNMNPITLSRQAKSHTGKTIPSKWKGVVQIKDGKTCKIYESLSSAEKDGFLHSCVIRCCNGNRSHYKGYKWMYLSDYEKLLSNQ